MSPVRTLALAQLQADLRNPRTGARAGGRVAMTVVAYGVSGLVLALALGGATPEATLFVAGSFAMVLAAFGVVGSYDDLMGRPKDNAWLATLPASQGQHYTARLLGIAMYVALMAVGVSVPVGIRSGLAHGGGTGLAVGVVVAAGVAWTAALCLAVLWGVTLVLPPRLTRAAVATVRTGLIGALVIGYQWVGTETGAAAAPWWPGAWLADALGGRPTLGLGLLAGSGVALVVVLGAAFPRRYFRLLDRLAHGASDAELRGRGDRRLTAPERALAPPGAFRAAYGFAVAAMADDRIVRGRIVPAAILPLVFVLFGWLSGGLESLFLHDPMQVVTSPDTGLHLSVLVVLLFCAHTLVQTLQFSDHAAAAWVFETLPAVRPRALQAGAQQALLLRVLVPLHAAMWAGLALQMPALDAALHALFWLAVAACATRGYALAHRSAPFSRHGERLSAGGRFAPLLASIPAALVALGIQVVAFQTRPRALAVALGLLALHELAGRVVARRGGA